MIIAESNRVYDLTGQTIWQSPEENSALHIEGVENVTVRGGTFVGTGLPWYEWRMMIKVLGSRNILLEKIRFQDPVGDAVYIDQGSDGVTIQNSGFYGTGANRCGIGLISGWNVSILRNEFVGMSRPDMPGAIDLEPDTADQPIWNVLIEGNTISGGNGCGIQLYNGIAHATQFGEITIQHNTITGSRRVAIGCWGSPQVTEGRVTVQQNTISGAEANVAVSDMAIQTDEVKRRHKHKKRKKHR